MRNKFFQLSLLLLIGVFFNTVMAQENYGFQVAGVEVNSANASDLSVINGVSGVVTYDNETKTLVLDNATIEAAKGIENKLIDNFKIELKGSNSITINGEASGLGFDATENAAIEQMHVELMSNEGGSLTIRTSDDGAVYVLATVLTIKDCKLVVNGRWGLCGYDGSYNEQYVIDNATVKAKGTEGSIVDIKSLDLNNCSIVTPEGAAFNTDLHSVALNGAKVVSEIIISPSSGVKNIAFGNIKMYPNPVVDVLKIQTEDTHFTVDIYDLKGVLVKQSENQKMVDVSDLESAIYMVIITTPRGVFSHKMKVTH